MRRPRKMFTLLVVLAVSPWQTRAEFNYYSYPRPAAPFGQTSGFALPNFQMNPSFLPPTSFHMPYHGLSYMRQPAYQNTMSYNVQQVTNQQSYNHNGVGSGNFNNYDSGPWRPVQNVVPSSQQPIRHSSGVLLSSQFASGARVPAQSPSAAPVITKNIYFHIPPPDIEQPRAAQLQRSAPKKIYKIVFIKVPSQEGYSRSQAQSIRSQQAAVEEKTLIYVLVNKPEPQKLPEPSKPEVFFVKYKGEADKVMTQISGSVSPDLPASPLPGSAVLKPGLVNGRQ